MTNPSEEFLNHDEFSDIERLVFEAREFVVPSEDLRPRTLEAAREICGQKRKFRRLWHYGLACLLVWLACLPTARTLSAFRTQIAAPTTEELQQIALELSDKNGYGPDWGLVEAFDRMRGQYTEPANSVELNLMSQ